MRYVITLVLLTLLLTCAVQADTVRYTVAPMDLAAGKPFFSTPHGTGTNPFGFDWDSTAPESASGAPSGYGSSSFYASVSQTGAEQWDRYRSLRIGFRSLFGHTVTVGQVKSLSYCTAKPAPQTAIDWRFSIYTTWQASSNNMSTWYRSRIQSHPAGARNLNAPANQWNLWSTDEGINQLIFSTNRPGFSTESMSWNDMAAGSVTCGGNTWDYSGEEIMIIDIIMGANSGGGTGESQLDAVKIELTNGEVAVIDLEANGNSMWLEVLQESQFVKPGESVSISLHQAYLTNPVVGYQAFLMFDPNMMTLASSAYTVAPYTIHPESSIPSASNEINLFGGISWGSSPTQDDAALANLTFTAGDTEGFTQVVFRANEPVTQFSDNQGNGILPQTFSGANIYIDKTEPTITAPANKTVNTDAGQPYATVALGTPIVSDNYGIASVTNDAPVSGQYPVGVTTVTWTVTDLAGYTVTTEQTVTVEDEELPTITAPSDITVDADAGHPYAVVDLVTPVTDDNCGVDTVTNNAPATFPIGVTTVTWTVTDIHGNSNTATQSVTVLGTSKMTVTVVLQQNVAASFIRDIEFVLGGSGGSENTVAPVTIVEENVPFVNGVASVSLDVPATGTWTAISAKDARHTLRMKVPVAISGTQYTADFTTNPLVGGDLTNDNWIDILDFGVLSGQWGQPARATGRDADITGDNTVNDGDFGFIQINFLEKSDLAVGTAGPVAASSAMAAPASAASGPRSSISVKDLAKVIGMSDARKADINKDGVVDTTDISLFAQNIKGKGK